MTALRSQVAAFLDRPAVTRFIIAVIIFNAVILGLETSKPAMAAAGDTILFLDRLCLAIFIIELALKLFAHGRALLPLWLERLRPRRRRRGPAACQRWPLGPAGAAGAAGAARHLHRAPACAAWSKAFFAPCRGWDRSLLLIGLILFYISAVMATKLFGAQLPRLVRRPWPIRLFRCFRSMTLESWSMGIVRPVMEVYPYAWAFFMPFILVTTFAVMNLLVGLIVNSMQEAASVEQAEAERDKHAELMARLDAIERRLTEKG